MNRAEPARESKTRWPVAARRSGLAAFVITSALVSWLTPDGNLVVTLVPALVMGLLVFGVAVWRLRRGGPA